MFSVHSLRIKTDKTVLPSLLLTVKSPVSFAVRIKIKKKKIVQINMAKSFNQHAKIVVFLFCLLQVRFV